jgi:hypothetical protein
MIPLSERKVSGVRLRYLQSEPMEPEGALHMGFSCEIQLQTFDGEDHGPIATLALAVPISDETTIQDFERAALSRVAEMLGLLGKFSADDLSKAFRQTRSKEIQQTKEYGALKKDSEAA